MGTYPNKKEFLVTDCEKELLLVLRNSDRDHIRQAAADADMRYGLEIRAKFMALYVERENAERPEPCPTCDHVKHF